MSFLSGSGPDLEYQPRNFDAGGLHVGTSGNVTAAPERTGLVDSAASLYGQEGNIYGGLRATVGPGFNSLLDARLNQINDAARSSIGDLRQNLQSRRILGSSFGNDTIARNQAEFSRLRDQTIADNFLKSLAVNQQLTQQEFAARRNEFATKLNELNLETELGSKINMQANQILANNAQAQLRADSAASQMQSQFFGSLLGSGIGTVFGPSLSMAGNALGRGIFG